MKPQTLRTIVIVIIAALLGYYIGVTKINYSWKNYHPSVNVVSKDPPPGVTNLDLTMFWTVLQKIQAGYYDKSKIDSQKLLNGAISGMVGSLDDPYTMYLPPAQNSNFKQGLSGKFTGIGAELGMKGNQIIVVAPLDGSPAQKAGIKAGDSIVKVNNVMTSGWNLNQTVDKIRGEKGTKVSLSVVHKSEQKVSQIDIVRDEITVKSVVSWIKQVKDITEINKDAVKGSESDEVAYIHIGQFGDNTNQEWIGLTNKIDSERKKNPNLKGVIVDVRNNPGGYLTDAVYIASEFIPDGTVVMQEDGQGQRISLPVSRQGLLTDIPVIVLINGGSASASEILSGALRDHNRAKLVGEKSFGKGTVQQAEDLGGGAGIHVTIAKWLTPNGTWVGNGKDGTGLIPDYTVNFDPKDPSHDTQLEKAVQLLVQ
jgi:carboxyl-terminal processing protease